MVARSCEELSYDAPERSRGASFSSRTTETTPRTLDHSRTAEDFSDARRCT
jgi:hypothetical protein